MKKYQKEAATNGPKVIVISGPAGIGKTALTLHFAHTIAELFPHGQLFTGESEQSTWGAGWSSYIQAGFIEGLQGPDEIVPEEAKDRHNRYLQLLSDRRVLIVVDDARDEEGVRRLLPPTSSCTVVVTSRAHILLTADQLDIAVEPLDDEASLSLLGAMVGAETVSRDITAATQIVHNASGYPLAVRLAGASLATRRYWGLGHAVMRLEEKTGRLDRSAGAIPGGGLLDMTYVMLTEDEREALRAIGLIGEPLFEPWMVAALVDRDVPSATRLIESLIRERLIERLSEDADEAPQFRVHEQVLTYARARLQAESTAAERHEGIAKLAEKRVARQDLAPSLQLREEVFTWLDQGKLAMGLNTARDALAVAHLKGEKEAAGLALAALAELYLEMGYLDDANEMALNALSSPESPSHPRALRCMAKVKRRLRQIAAAQSLLEEADKAAQEQEDLSERIRILRELAAAQAVGESPRPGIATADAALQLCDERDDRGRRLRAGVLWSKGSALLYAGEPEEAMLAFREAEQISIREGQRLWTAWIGQGLSRVAMETADYERSKRFATRAVEMFRDMRHRYGIAHCRLLLGQIYNSESNTEDAARIIDQALETFQGCGDRWMTASAMHALALTYLDRGDLREAASLLQGADRIYEAVADQENRRRVRRELNSSAMLWTRLIYSARN